MLQNSLLIKQDQYQQSMKRQTLIQQTLAFVHNLFPSLNNQHSVTHTPQPNQIGSTVSKLTKVLPDLLLFTNRKDPFID